MSQALPYSLEQLQNAFGYVESSNRYDAIGPETRRGDNAYGRYQVMDFNVPSWSEQYYGQRLTPQEFLTNPQAQDAVFYGRMGEYYSQGQGAPEDRVRNAASLWFTGQPYSAETANRSDGFINNQEYGNRILRALGSAPQGASEMTMDPNPPQQPRGFLGGIFGGQQRQPDPNAGSPTDPFANLSRAQRTMLGFAALRDAAASLEGRDSNYFSSALGGFEAARERERLRAQGIFQNQVAAAQALAQVQADIARNRSFGIEPTEAQLTLERMLSGAALEGFGGVTPRVTTGATPPVTPAGGVPGATPGVVQNADQYLADQAIQLDPETGGVNAAGDPMLAETPAPVVEPLPEAAPTPVAEPDVAAQIRELDEEYRRLTNQVTQRLAAGAGITDLEFRIDDNRARLAELTQAQAAAEQTSAQQAETESRMQPLIDDALNFLVDNGRIREGASLIGDQSAFASGVLTPGVSAGDVRLARAAVRELGAIAAMQGVREAREGGFGGSLSDADIALIQSSGGTFDLSEPEATVRTLQSLQAAMDSNGEAGDEDGYETVTTRFGDVRIRVRD